MKSESDLSQFRSIYKTIRNLDEINLEMVILWAHLVLVSKKGKKTNKKKLTNYKSVAPAMNLFAAALGWHLENLFTINIENKDPLYGALMVNKEIGIPSHGFFGAVKRANLVSDFNDENEKKKFWESEISKIYDSNLDLLISNLSPSQKAELVKKLTSD